MQLKHIMTHEVETIGPDASLQQAAQIVGDQVPVIYDPGNPRNAQAQSIGDEYLGTIVSGLVGLPFLLVGIAGVVVARFKTNRQQQFRIQTMNRRVRRAH